ncbi:MAG TPA: hypothetical protein PLP04_20365 [Bryobacteraceae bacterium]|nr:hypothetical protein [Bryobacteraceae bacterium]
MNHVPTRRWILVSAAVATLMWATRGGWAAPPAEPLRVSATRKTVASRQGPAQKLPHVSGRIDENEVVYRFEVQRLKPDVPEHLRVKYLIVIQGALGNLRAGTMKEEEIVVSGSRPATFETEPVTLRRIEWNRGGPGSGELREKAYGWAIRITDLEGRILLEKCQPKDIESQLDRLMKEAGRDDPPRGWPVPPRSR